jgi:hypothetical protein
MRHVRLRLLHFVRNDTWGGRSYWHVGRAFVLARREGVRIGTWDGCSERQEGVMARSVLCDEAISDWRVKGKEAL